MPEAEIQQQTAPENKPPEQNQRPGQQASQKQQKPPEQKKRGLPSGVKWTIAIALLAALAVGGWMYWSYSSVRESTDDAQIDGHIYPVSAMIDGTVLEVLVDNNQYVEAGTVLARIDPKYY